MLENQHRFWALIKAGPHSHGQGIFQFLSCGQKAVSRREWSLLEDFAREVRQQAGALGMQMSGCLLRSAGMRTSRSRRLANEVGAQEPMIEVILDLGATEPDLPAKLVSG